jgi:(p)ppGpp synthase/HD superfamily hydrolase
LHDVIEDAGVKYEEIKAEFGMYVAELVRQAGEPDKKAPWKERKLHTLESLKQAPGDLLLVACADKLDNIRSIKRDYEKLGEKVWERFNSSKDDQQWYYKELAGMFSCYTKGSAYSPIFTGFINEVKAVFG